MRLYAASFLVSPLPSMKVKMRILSVPKALARSMAAVSSSHCVSRFLSPSGLSGGSGTLKNPVPSMETLMPCSSRILSASRIFSMGCEVLYGPQMLRISAQCRLYCWRNLAAVRTSSSISSVRMPSLISASGSARRRCARRVSAEPASRSRRVGEYMQKLYPFGGAGDYAISMANDGTSRRQFFFGALLAGAVPAAGFGSTPSLRHLGYKSPNEKLNIAAIGAGGKGRSRYRRLQGRKHRRLRRSRR